MLLDRAVVLPTLRAAFERVKANRGCAGVDRVTPDEFEERLERGLLELRQELADGSYAPLPLLRILVGKPNGEPRALSIPTVRDRVAQAAVLQVIEPILEAEFEDSSFAYRRGRSVRQAVARVQELYDHGYRWVVDADIDAFFDQIDQHLLLQKVVRLIQEEGILRPVRLWVTAEVWDGRQVVTLTRGIPQGSVVSPILANLFLDELDETLEASGHRLVRFADDFLILCKTPERARQALELTEETLKKMSLALDEADIVNFDQGFTFLGVMFVRSMAMVPLHRLRPEPKVLYVPPPLDLAAYRRSKAEAGSAWPTST